MPICGCKRSRRTGLAAILGGGAGLLVLAGLYLWLLGGPTPQRAEIGAPFALAASTGGTVSDRSFPGRTLLIYFGYTHCRDVCPATLTGLDSALNRLGKKAAQVQPIFITVDPTRDTPAVLRDYVGSFSPRLIGLTGTQAQIRAVQRAYHIDSVAHPAGSGGYDVDHGSALFLVRPDGRGIIPIRADADAAELAATISRHLS